MNPLILHIKIHPLYSNIMWNHHPSYLRQTSFNIVVIFLMSWICIQSMSLDFLHSTANFNFTTVSKKHVCTDCRSVSVWITAPHLFLLLVFICVWALLDFINIKTCFFLPFFLLLFFPFLPVCLVAVVVSVFSAGVNGAVVAAVCLLVGLVTVWVVGVELF